MGRVGNLLKGVFELFVRKMEQENPQALLEAELASFHEATAKFNQNLAKQSALVERIRVQVGREDHELEKLTGRAAALFKAGNTKGAGRLALDLKDRKSQAEENRDQLNSAKDLLDNMTRQRDAYVREAKRRFEKIKQKMNRAEIAEAQAQLADIATDNAFSPTGANATLERLEEDLDDRIYTADGKTEVAKDLQVGSEWAHLESEQEALEQAALEELAASLGLAKETEEEALQEIAVSLGLSKNTGDEARQTQAQTEKRVKTPTRRTVFLRGRRT